MGLCRCDFGGMGFIVYVAEEAVEDILTRFAESRVLQRRAGARIMVERSS